mgnify:FL=1
MWKREKEYGEDLEFEEGCNIDLIELSNNIFRLRELINRYIKEEDEYYTEEE